jgi:hypothetical protein
MGSTPQLKRFGHYALLAVLLTAAVPRDAIAQQLVCSPIRPGETAALVARRITGDARNTWQSWFQILNPATSRFVSKSSYDYIRAGWRACIVNEPRTTAATTGAVRLVRGFDSNLVLWGLLVVVIALTTHGMTDYLGDRAITVAAMRRFGERFVQEFERPLIQPDFSDRPIQARLRFIPHRARLDVLLAPNAGRRYPNLADHKKNVEYDVTRVVQVLRDYAFVTGRLYARGHWVVVPFQLTIGNKQAGGK